MKLNLGCFNDIKEGYINLDQKKYNNKVDVVHDLTKFPYPFKDNTFHEINAIYVLEHLDIDRIKFYDELHRISKHKGMIKIKVPFREKMFRSPDHKGCAFTFQHFRILCSFKRNYITNNNFELIELGFDPTNIGRYIPTNRLRIVLSHFLNEIIENINVKIRVVKNED